MSSFFDFKLEAPAQGQILCMTWNRTAPVLAVSNSMGTVDLHQEEGEKLASLGQPRECGACSLTWHPRHKLLLMGWEDGLLSVWSIVEDKVRPYSDAHSKAISVLEWTADGSRLVSGSDDGLCYVWKWDKRKGLQINHKYDLKSPVTHCVFRHDMSMQTGSVGNTFFIATKSGAVFCADDYGQCSEAFHANTTVLALMLYEESNTIVVINKALVFSRHKIAADRSTTVKMKVKMSTSAVDALSLRASWTLPGLLATVSSENMVRFWNQQNNENYILSLADVEGHKDALAMDKISCVGFNGKKQLLAVGTTAGKVVVWRYTGGLSSTVSSDWQVVHVKDVGEKVEDVHWGPGSGLLAAKLKNDVNILVESPMQTQLWAGMSAIQVSRNTIAVENRLSPDSFLAETKIRVKGLDINSTNLVVWSGKQVEVYHVVSGCSLEHSFDMQCSLVCLSKQGRGEDTQSSLFCVQGNKIVNTNLAGTVKTTLSLSEAEGRVLLLDVCAGVMAAYTDEHVLKLWNVSGRVIKEMRLGKRFEGEDIVGAPVGMRTNCDGTRIALIANTTSRAGTTFPATTIFVYEVDNGLMRTHDFGPYRYPVSVSWDPSESKLLSVETVANVRGRSYLQDAKESAASPFGGKNEQAMAERELALLFATPVDGVLVQDSFPLVEPLDRSLGVCVPYVYFVAKVKDERSAQKRTITRTMRDFIGMEDADDESKQALIDFSYYLTTGNMDEAFKAVKLIKSSSVWENMAHMCVKTKRLDVAVVCLGNMGHARGSRAVREAMEQEPELEAQVAMVAIQLGLLDDAARLYIECGRFDLLNYLCQCSNQWEKAVEVARGQDRLHLRTTFFNFGKYLEAIGDISSAVQAYERSETHRTEVPRMLASDLPMLQKYVDASNDKVLKRWWAQFAELKGDHNTALKYYEQAGDYRALIKILCFDNNYAKAVEVANVTSDPAACFHLARQCEAEGRVKEAMHFYGLSQRYSHAVQLAKAHSMDNELITLALRSTKPLMIDAARYYEDKQIYDKAVMLFHKGGYLAKAVDLCFQTEQFEALRNIAETLDESADPELLHRCARFFVEHKQYEQAVAMYIAAGQGSKALEMCADHGVPITEDMAEAMTPPKAPAGDAAAATARNEELRRLAQCLNDQKSYHLACKKYTQAGDKVTAMKCLLRSGDTDKIMFFAGVSKSKEIYVLAAHYLQRLDWKNDAEIRKNIIQYYTKGRAYDALALFFGECSEVEVDTYKNYEQALNALKEAVRYMGRAPSGTQNAAALTADWTARVQWVEKFVRARQLHAASENPEEIVTICKELLQSAEVERAVRAGDVFNLLVQLAFQQGDMRQAYNFIEMMQARRIRIQDYLEGWMVEQICQALGVRLNLQAEAQVADDNGVEERIGM